MTGDLFSVAPSPAHVAKEEAIERVGANAPSEWMRKAMAVTRAIAHAKARERSEPFRQGFSSDDVWFVLDACGYGSPPEPRALGAVFATLARDRIIIKTGEYRDSERVENHGRPVCIWRLVGKA